MFDSVLAPTDGSERAVRAAEQAVALAGAPTVHALAVADLTAEAGPFSAGGVDAAFREQRRSDARRDARALADHLATDARIAVRTGRPHEGILAYADEHDVDGIAMTTRGNTGVRRLLTGSVTERVLRGATRPVLAVQPDPERGLDDGCTDLLVPTDGSTVAEGAAERGIALAGHLDARLHVLSVVDLGTVAARPGLTPTTADVDRLQAEGEAAVASVAHRCAAAGVETVTDVREGIPAQDIVAYADREGIDLFVLGTHGHSGIRRVLAGSVTERVLRRADAPVLAVPG